MGTSNCVSRTSWYKHCSWSSIGGRHTFGKKFHFQWTHGGRWVSDLLTDDPMFDRGVEESNRRRTRGILGDVPVVLRPRQNAL